MKPKIVLGLSGGVDSAVAAAQLLQDGYDVYGHWLDIGLGGREDAQAVAERLHIPFSTGDIRAPLEAEVCTPFAQEYLAGRTPLPCARCNVRVKFPALFQAAEAVGADLVATGHYARVVTDDQGTHFLARGNPANDQAYMLARLPQAWLPRLRFPLGEFPKVQVRQMARDLGLPVAEKPDSMEICFIPNGDYAAWLDARRQPPPPGPFVDRTGTVLGTHRGIHHYTLGQRRGLSISASHRLFVTEIRPETNEVVLSDGSDLSALRVWCTAVNSLADLKSGDHVTVRLRHSKVETPAVLLWEDDDVLRLELQMPARAPTPGQLAVFYRHDLVLGSGWITKGERCVC